MCNPRYFSVDYVINPWMKPGSVNRNRAIQQWENLVASLERQNIAVISIDPVEGFPDMVFSADQGITINNKVLLSNFRYPNRQGETAIYKKWFENNNFFLRTLPKDCFLEGSGESLFVGDTLFIGVGFRSSKTAPELVAQALNIDVVPLELVDSRFYHLDLAFFPLNKDTAFYYPPAFSEASQEILKNMIPNLQRFTDDEITSFAANSLVTDHHVVVQKNHTTFNDRLKELGYAVIEADVSEFLKAGGGIHCLVQVLEEAYE